MKKLFSKFRIDQIEGLVLIVAITSLITFGVLQYAEMHLQNNEDEAQHQSIEQAQQDEGTVQASHHSKVDLESGEVAIK